MRSLVLSPLVFVVLGCQSEPTKRVYEYHPSEPRPIFISDPKRLVQWIDVPDTGGGIVIDGPEVSPGSYSGGFIYTKGGTIGFADGSTERFAQIKLSYDGRGGHYVQTDPSILDGYK